jgi:FkbM family methyltransferase
MSITKVNSRWGEVAFYSKDEYVGKSLWNYGEYNPDETEMIINLATTAAATHGSDMLCLDIGANFGVMGMALRANGFTVASFEPQPLVFELLKSNVNSMCFNCGLGSEEGTAKMGKLRYSERNNIGGLGIGTVSPFGTIDVSVKTLDSFEFENVGFMKVDVEGFEEKVLIGGRSTILRDKPIMYIEDDRAENSASLHRMIRSLGYEFTSHRPPLYRQHNFFNKKKNVWDKNYVSHNLICIPK